MPYLIFTITLCIIVALFAVQNAMSISLNFFVWSFNTSLVIVILGSFLVGVLVGGLYILMLKARHYMQDKRLRDEIAALKKDNQMLEERVGMLLHTQKMHSEAAAKNNAEEKAEQAAVRK